MSPSEIRSVIDELRAFAAPRRRLNGPSPVVPSDLANLADGWADRLEDALPEPPERTT